MELWASGFNAWSQLQFDGELPAEPRDLDVFACVLKNEHIEILRTSLSATVVQTNSGIITAGFPDEFTKLCSKSNGRLFKVALAGNDKVSEFAAKGVTQYDSLQDFAAKKKSSFRPLSCIAQIASNQTGFTLLTSNGTVYTWGDGRYEACLGREVNDERKASDLCEVDELRDLPDRVVKISSGGYMTAALTAGNDVYLWGRQGHPELAEPLMASPTPLDLDGHDCLDVAVGMNHLIVLTTERRIFVVGSGRSGQLGLGSAIIELKEWKEVVMPLKKGQHVVSVHAAYKNSFVRVKDGT
ncbi:Regulator of chromosome condensation [Hyphodiscus hymeniophilus]|uniref:Regulator of chromosome condensation n=1 Tax=Hyphodiscus hymeniophilus TaxID=353542 RepID=A0A9P6VQ64_9HELO|nr:Regulator of chromosome condensation [Hyphodiscus hymeniophilus]